MRLTRAGRYCWCVRILSTLLLAVLVAGCGGGGGSSSSTGTAQTVTITGILEDKMTQTPLPNRTVTVQNTGLTGVSDANGRFTITGVTVETITLTVTDSVGTSDGTASIDLTKLTGNPRNVGTLLFDLSSVPAPPTVI